MKYYLLAPSILFTIIGGVVFFGFDSPHQSKIQDKRPNILFAISDDQSFPHTSISGDKTTLTPAFDALARRGILFQNAFCAAPQCSPSRAAILTGKNIWQLEEAGSHSSYFPKKFRVFTDLLEEEGYALGYTGKPWGPGNWQDAGWSRNPVGPAYNDKLYDEVPYTGINKRNYAANFADFLTQKDDEQPFFFWYGGHEPHRVFEDGSGKSEGKKMKDAAVPPFLPDDKIVRSDMLDYSVEIEWFDYHLHKMIAQLEAVGELDNTIIIVTADNGMAFPSAKANLQEYGTHVPLVIAGPNIAQGKKVNSLISLIDIGPSLLALVGAPELPDATGLNFISILQNKSDKPIRDFVLTGRERHTHARPDNLGYPARAIRTDSFLYIHNFKPARWPAGDPEVIFPSGHESLDGYKSMAQGYHDIDACPSKTLLLDNQEKYGQYFDLAVAKRPAQQLYQIIDDPGCLDNLADDRQFKPQLEVLHDQLFELLTIQKDPRVIDGGDIFDSYPRFAGMREFSGFRERGKYNPKYQK